VYEKLKKHKYDILVINGKHRLIKTITNATEDVRYYVKTRELFDIIYSTVYSVTVRFRISTLCLVVPIKLYGPHFVPFF